MEEYDFDVIICGYGPTGQAAASLLSRLGHSVGVFERWPSLYGQPRLCTLDAEAARILQAAGDVDFALRDSNPCRKYFLLNKDGKVLIDIDWSTDDINGYPTRISMHQPDIEVAMDQAAKARGARVFQGFEVLGAQQDKDRVTVEVRKNTFDTSGNLDGEEAGEVRTVTARYLIAADGARSPIRTALGIGKQDFPFRNAWLSLDVKRKRELGTFFDVSPDLRIPFVVCAPEGETRAAVPIGYTRIRFEFLVDPDSDHTEQLDPAIGYEYLSRYFDLTEDDVELYRSVIYPFAGAVAERWRDGRILLAGDAAHLMTPFLGQGACSGLRDSVNISWKLDLVLRGVSDDSLLDTYEEERRPHVSALVAGSDALGAMACEPDPELAAGRDAFLLSGQAPPMPGDPVLTSGVLVSNGGAPELPVGAQSPQGLVTVKGFEGKFDEVVGWGFQLIAYDDDPRSSLSQSQLDFLEDINCVIAGVGSMGKGVLPDEGGTYRRFFEEHGIAAYISRPDFAIFGVARAPSEVPALVDMLRLQLESAGTLR